MVLPFISKHNKSRLPHRLRNKSLLTHKFSPIFCNTVLQKTSKQHKYVFITDTFDCKRMKTNIWAEECEYCVLWNFCPCIHTIKQLQFCIAKFELSPTILYLHFFKDESYHIHVIPVQPHNKGTYIKKRKVKIHSLLICWCVIDCTQPFA